MSFLTYSGLKSAVADWMDRTDLTSRMADFVQLGEARLNRILRTQDQITVATLTASSEYANLPSDWAQTSRLNYSGNPLDKLTFLAVDSFEDERANYPAGGKPKYYTIVGRRARFLPVPDTSYSLTHIYWASIPALSDSNTSNWLLTAHPDIYLNATLYFAQRFVRDAEGMNEADADLVRAIGELGVSDDRSKMPTTPRMRTKPI